MKPATASAVIVARSSRLHEICGLYTPALQPESFWILRRNLGQPRLRSPCYCE
ncbi:MAG: hypothetical protein ACK5HO_05105 [Pseudomonadota bacterium]